MKNNMKIDNYNITLLRLNFDLLESLRNWRNSDYVNNQMLFNDYITEEMQLNWFNNLDANKNYYFIAFFQNSPVGVIHIKDIIGHRGEGGIFLIDSKFENTDVVARMVVCFNDFVFYKLKIQCIYSHVKRTNKKAISSSISQGCKISKDKSTSDVIYFELFPENYEKKILKIKKILK